MQGVTRTGATEGVKWISLVHIVKNPFVQDIDFPGNTIVSGYRSSIHLDRLFGSGTWTDSARISRPCDIGTRK